MRKGHMACLDMAYILDTGRGNHPHLGFEGIRLVERAEQIG